MLTLHYSYRTFLPINMTLDLQPHLNHNNIGLLHLADLKSPQSARHSWEIDLRRLLSPNSACPSFMALCLFVAALGCSPR